MSSNSPDNKLFTQIRLPAQDLPTLSFCGGNKPAKVKDWAESLPATRVSYTSVQLYKALPELARLKIDPASRIEMLESVRPYVQQCIQGLSKEFLNQPLILPEAALKTATVAQALQKHMTNAYAVAARDMTLKLKGEKSRKHDQLTLAIHRAIAGQGLQLLRSYQLYIPVPPQLWLELHALFRLAEHFNLLEQVISDDLLTHSQGNNVKQAYLRVLLLACSRPNQLRQTEVNATYTGLELWTSFITLSSAEEQNLDNLFLVNLSSDLPPMYKSRFRSKPQDDIRELDIRQLITAIKKQKESKDEGQKILTIPREISSQLIDHLSGSWAISRQRSFERNLARGSLEICAGLTNIHYHLSDTTPFKQFLRSPGQQHSDDDPFQASEGSFDSKPLSSEKDPWAEAFDAGRHTMGGSHVQTGNKRPPKDMHPIFEVDMLDASPGGYCLDWRDSIPVQVRAGELLAMREPGRRKWSIGVIRWIRQSKGATQLGIQVLAPQAKPYGASMVQTSGGNTEYMRVLMLPELKAINQPASLLTTVVPFREYSKVKLNQLGEESTVQLTRRLFSTGSVSQFSFRELEGAKPQASDSDDSPKNFDSVWNDI